MHQYLLALLQPVSLWFHSYTILKINRLHQAKEHEKNVCKNILKSYTCQFQRIRSFEAMKIISTVMISYYLFLYRAVHGVHHTLLFAVYLLHFFPFQVNAHQFRFIKNEWVNRFDWIDNSIDSMNLFNEIHFIVVDHFQFYKQYSCNSCEQCCLAINLSADRKNINIYAHKPLNKEK